MQSCSLVCRFGAMVCALIVGCPKNAGAVIVNGDFSTGDLTGWTMGGFGFGVSQVVNGTAWIFAERPEFSQHNSQVSISQQFHAFGGNVLSFESVTQGSEGSYSAAVIRDVANNQIITQINLRIVLPGLTSRTLPQTGDYSIEFVSGASVGAPFTYDFSKLFVDNVMLNQNTGGVQSDPILPVGGGFQSVPGTGLWFDPIAASGFHYATDGSSLFTTVGLPSGLGDADGLYVVNDGINGPVVVAAGTVLDFPTPVSQFTVTGINPTVDGENPLAFPTFLKFNNSLVSFTMTPVPEPSTCFLITTGMIIAFAARRRNRGARLNPATRR